MKIIRNTLSKISLVIMTVLISLCSFAQNGGGADVNVDINKGGGSNWYTQPWVWIVGAALFILLLVALLRNNSSRD